jgi:uncharacterized integral membrane protein
MKGLLTTALGGLILAIVGFVAVFFERRAARRARGE